MFGGGITRLPASQLFRCAVLASALGVMDTAWAADRPVCKPALAFKDVNFSGVNPETLMRTWSATVSVDASRCASSSGRFEILFTRQKENAIEVDFIEPFEWRPGAVEIAVEFWADEAVEDYRATRIAECPCRQ